MKGHSLVSFLAVSLREGRTFESKSRSLRERERERERKRRGGGRGEREGRGEGEQTHWKHKKLEREKFDQITVFVMFSIDTIYFTI